MKLKQAGSNQTILILGGGIEVFFSYETPVACFISGEGYYRTNTYYSRTTSKHINSYLGGSMAVEKDQSFFDDLIN